MGKNVLIRLFNLLPEFVRRPQRIASRSGRQNRGQGARKIDRKHVCGETVLYVASVPVYVCTHIQGA